jgi:hypothetical protein
MEKIKKFIRNNDVDVLILIGTFFMAVATFKINFIAFLYFIGIIFIGSGLLLLKYPKKR